MIKIVLAICLLLSACDDPKVVHCSSFSCPEKVETGDVVEYTVFYTTDRNDDMAWCGVVVNGTPYIWQARSDGSCYLDDASK